MMFSFVGAVAPACLVCQCDGLFQVVAENACAVVAHGVIVVVLASHVDADNAALLVKKTNDLFVCSGVVAVAAVGHLKACFCQLGDGVGCLHV